MKKLLLIALATSFAASAAVPAQPLTFKEKTQKVLKEHGWAIGMLTGIAAGIVIAFVGMRYTNHYHEAAKALYEQGKTDRGAGFAELHNDTNATFNMFQNAEGPVSALPPRTPPSLSIEKFKSDMARTTELSRNECMAFFVGLGGIGISILSVLIGLAVKVSQDRQALEDAKAQLAEHQQKLPELA